MGYAGYLLKVGNYTITGRRYINFASYDVTREVQDLDPYRDENGVLHRNTCSNVPIKITFDTRESLTNADLAAFLGSIANNYTGNRLERKCSVTAYVPELDDYITQTMYMAGPTIKIKKIEGNVVYYESFQVSFIGY